MTDSSSITKWEWRAYWEKARAYHRRGAELGGEETAFRSTVALEFLARAVLTKINPALNAQPNDDGVSLLHACGFAVPGTPQSVQMKTVYARLEKIAPETFTPTISKKCRALTTMRNEELHTGQLPFAALKSSDWLPGFYEGVAVLCDLLPAPLEDFLGQKEAVVAREVVQAAHGSQLSAIRQKVASFTKVFNEKPEPERLALRLAALKHWGHQQVCPACGNPGVVAGRSIRESSPVYGADGLLTTEETYAADSFACGACGLSLTSLEEVIAAGIEPTFRVTTTWDPSQDARTDDGPDYENM